MPHCLLPKEADKAKLSRISSTEASSPVLCKQATTTTHPFHSHLSSFLPPPPPIPNTANNLLSTSQMPPRRRGVRITVGARTAASSAIAANVAAAQLTLAQQQQWALLLTLISSSNFSQVKQLVNGEMWTIPENSDLLGKALIAALRGRNTHKSIQFLVTDVGVPVLGECEDEAPAACGYDASNNLSTPLGKALAAQDMRAPFYSMCARVISSPKPCWKTTVMRLKVTRASKNSWRSCVRRTKMGARARSFRRCWR